LALAVGAGLQVMATLMAEDVTALCARRATTTRAAARCVTAPRPGR